MISKKKELNVINIILFLASPFLALPSILIGIYKFKSKFSLNLLALFMGLTAYMYIPTDTNDKTAYYFLYQRFQNYSWSQFLDYFFIDPNILFNFSLYISSKIGLPFQILSFVLTYFIVKTVIYIFDNIIKETSFAQRIYFLSFILIILSFSFKRLYSGFKFHLGVSFLLLSFYEGILNNKNKKGLLFLFLAVLGHYSLMVFAPVYFIIKYLPNKTSIYRSIFLVSLIFLFVQISGYFGLIKTLGLAEGYINKADAYLNNEDVVKQRLMEGGSSSLIRYLSSVIWSYVAYLYLIFRTKQKSVLRNIVYLSFALTNLFYGLPFVFSRYLDFLAIIFALLVTYESRRTSEIRYIFMFILLFLLNLGTDLIIMRYNLYASYIDFEVSTLISILFREYPSYL